MSDAVRVCDLFGRGYFFIPGSDSCLRFGGRVRAEVIEVDGLGEGIDGTTSTTISDFFVDAKTPTELGVLQSYISLRAISEDSGTLAAIDPEFTNASVSNAGNEFSVYLAYGRFYGGTLGLTRSYFDAPATLGFSTLRASSERQLLAAYTLRYDRPWAFTLSVEDNEPRRLPILTSDGSSAVVSTGLFVDPVLSVDYVQDSWRARLAGAVHSFDTPDTGLQTGWAVQGGVDVRVSAFLGKDTSEPVKRMFARDRFRLTLAYADGAPSYLGYSTDLFEGSSVNGRFEAARGYSANLSYRHYWTEKLSSSFTVSHSRVETKGAGRLSDFEETQGSATIVWSPVRGLELGAEWRHVRQNVALDVTGDERADIFRIRASRRF